MPQACDSGAETEWAKCWRDREWMAVSSGCGTLRCRARLLNAGGVGVGVGDVVGEGVCLVFPM